MKENRAAHNQLMLISQQDVADICKAVGECTDTYDFIFLPIPENKVADRQTLIQLLQGASEIIKQQAAAKKFSPTLPTCASRDQTLRMELEHEGRRVRTLETLCKTFKALADTKAAEKELLLSEVHGVSKGTP